MFKGIIFDLDGVLVDTETFYAEIKEKFFKAYKIALPEEVLLSTVGLNARLSWEVMGDSFPKDWNFDIYKKRFFEFSKQYPLNYGKRLNQGAHEVLKILGEKGYVLSMATSSPIKFASRAIKECKLESYFKVVMTGDKVKESKPNPEIYIRTAELMGLKPYECIAIEDSLHGIESAKEAGMIVLALKDTKFGIDQSKADYFIDSLYDIVDLLNEIKGNIKKESHSL